MNKDAIVALLRDLAQRIEVDKATGNRRVEGLISEEQHTALNEAADLLSGKPHPHGPRTRPERRGPSFRSVELDDSCLRVSEPSIPGATLCLDFGTAMSKAFAVVGGDPVGLSLGAEANYSGSEFAVPSSIFIANDGRLYFGHEAIQKSDEEAGNPKCPRLRVDSPKQQLSVGDIRDLNSQFPSVEQNPTEVMLSFRDLITLYLGYLTQLAGEQLEKARFRGFLPRRIARPCWDPERSRWADDILSQMCVVAQILADSFRGRWSDGQLDVRTARAALDQVSDLMTKSVIPKWLNGGTVAEPVAAGFGRVFRGHPERRGFMVVDVGAGTTDFGLFVLSQLSEDRAPAIILAQNSVSSLRLAGDRIDAILRGRLLKRHSIDPQAGEEGRLISLHVNGNIRRWKESLFRDGELNYRLPNDISGKVILEEFQEDQQVKDFCDSLVTELAARLNSVHLSWIENLVSRQPFQIVMTGGSSTIPALSRLASGTVQAQGHKVSLVPSPDLPLWISEEQPQYASAYRQLAVAIGGAAPDLPDRLKEFERFGGGGPRTPPTIERFQVSGT